MSTQMLIFRPSMLRGGGPAAALLLCAVSLNATACASHSTPPANAASADTSAAPSDDDPVMSGLLEHHRYHHHGGVTLFIAMSLDTLGVSAEQRAAVEKIRLDLHARMQPALQADQNLVTALAAGLDAASFDSAKLDAAVAQVGSAAATTHDASADALNELHHTLTPAERGALVDKVESHWAVWQSANAEENGATGAENGHVAMLVADLGLTQEQADRIRASMGEGLKGVPRVDPQEVAVQLRAFGDAFRSDQFDAKSLTGQDNVNAHIAAWGAAHLAHFIEAVSPVLSAEQRAALAKRLREHAAHNPSAQVTP
jgi:Spy/CpxP family protein refolding chaperone